MINTVKNINLILLLLLFTLFIQIANAQSISTKVLFKHIELANAIEKKLEKPVLPNDDVTRKITSNTIQFKFDMGEEYLLGSNAFNTTIKLTVEPFTYIQKEDSNGTLQNIEVPIKATLQEKSVEVTLNESQPEAYYQINVREWFSGMETEIKNVIGYKISVVNYIADSRFSNYLRIKITNEVNYTIKVSGLELFTKKIDKAANPQTFKWKAVKSGSETEVSDICAWEFQLLRLYNIDENKTTETDITAYIDWSQALTLFFEQQKPEIKFTIGEGQGYYLWRVRPIGNYFEGGIANSENAGQWSDALDKQEIQLNLQSIPANGFFYSDPDNNINWMYNRSFTEGDENVGIKISEGKSYANALLQTRQSQAKSQAKGDVLASTIVYGYAGSGVLQSLPVPITNQTTFEYKNNLLKSVDGYAYTAKYFTRDAYYGNPTAADSSNSFSYYSDLNADVTIPSAQGFPFSITYYENNASGRVKEQSSLGYAHRMGGGHTSKYEYIELDKQELVDVLGDEAPAKNKMAKVKVTDANGISSIQYLNSMGKAVASCLLTANGASSYIESSDEVKTAKARNKENYHYTLFYYDRAGNLVKTVSPKGVKDTCSSREIHPALSFETEYDYNFLGQLIRKKSPDAGEIKYYYDNLKRLRFSVNAQQKIDGSYSYIKYDELNRPIEAGQSSLNASSIEDYVNDMDFPQSGTDRTYTIYNKAANVVYDDNKGNTEAQSFLLNRISYVYNEDKAYTYYSYDVHGNVKWMIQRMPELGDKYVKYSYDIFSGLVKEVVYNENRIDQFYQKYTYDADKRVVSVKTSRDGTIWDNDASYEFYTHGPLKRVILGEDSVQGIDYVYTIDGLLKGINHPELSFQKDPGKDGNINYSTIPADAFGMVINYYDGDFSRKGSAFNNVTEISTSSLTKDAKTRKSYYNGFISSIISNNGYKGSDLYNANKPMANMYIYDDRGWLTQNTLDFFDGAKYSGLTGPTTNFYEHFTYDANGNFETLDRNAY